MVDEEALARLRRVEGWRMAGRLLLAFATLAAFGVGVALVPGDGEPRTMLPIFAGGALLFGAAGLIVLLNARIPDEARSGPLAMIRAERLQAKRNTGFLILPVSLIAMLMGVLRATSGALSGRPLRHVDLFVLGAFLFFVIFFGLLVAGRGLDRWARPVLDDELSREIRAKALRLGYFILLPGVAVLFVLGLFRAQWAVECAPVLAVLGVGGPAVRIFALERAAAGDPRE